MPVFITVLSKTLDKPLLKVEMIRYYSNFTVADVRKRKGRNRFTVENWYDLSERLLGQFQAFSTWLRYGEDFYEYIQRPGPDGAPLWSVKDWNASSPAVFDIIPLDFDRKDDLPGVVSQVRSFIENELHARGIDRRWYAVYLSGAKGFHIELAPQLIAAELPFANAGNRIKALVAQWKEVYTYLDLMVYGGTSLVRLPGSRHKSGLYKTEIRFEDLTPEHIERRAEWANEAPQSVRRLSDEPAPYRFDLPRLEARTVPVAYNHRTDFDTNAVIIPNCRWLRKVLEDPSNKGQDGEGYEKRRNAIGILLSAHETSENNEELKWFVDQLSKHPYMQAEEKHMADVERWIAEYDADGEIKCKKTCAGIGCNQVQRMQCKTQSPLDWKVRRRKIETNNIDKARRENAATLARILDEDGNGVYILNWPVGIGKTHTLLAETSRRALTVFYVAQTHELALQSANNFTARGMNVRHLGSRDYLAANADFECVSPNEVAMAIQNGYGSHTVCARCPRKAKRDKDTGAMRVEDGYTPCEYYAQFEDLAGVQVVVGVHQHLFEWIYETADVESRALTVIDEAPLEVLAKEIRPIDPALLATIRQALAREVRELRSGFHPSQPVRDASGLVQADGQPARRGLFARAMAVINQQRFTIENQDRERQLTLTSVFANLFIGAPIDMDVIINTSDAQLRAVWYGIANKIVDSAGLNSGGRVPDDFRYLLVPFVLPDALELIARGVTYNPEQVSYIPALLPPNKTVILDATAHNDVYAPAIAALTPEMGPRHYEFCESPIIDQPYSHVTQVTTSSYGVSKLHNEVTINNMLAVIRGLRAKHPGLNLLVCHKQHKAFWEEAFKEDPLFDVAHYGALKGLNNWEDATAQYIIGTPFIPDEGVSDLSARLGQPVPLQRLINSAALRRFGIQAKDGSIATVTRRVYDGFTFQTALAQMRSQWEVTQAVRLRLYNPSTVGKQSLYIFSNVDLKGMYADTFKTFSELAYEVTCAPSGPAASLSVSGLEYEALNNWFKQLPKGHKFKMTNVPPVASDSTILRWLLALIEAEWVDKPAGARTYTKLVN